MRPESGRIPAFRGKQQEIWDVLFVFGFFCRFSQIYLHFQRDIYERKKGHIGPGEEDSMSVMVFSEERCVMCGETIPEGRMVCPDCERKISELPVSKREVPETRATMFLWKRVIHRR